MADTQLGELDVYVDRSGYEEGYINVRRGDDGTIWLKLGKNLVVCLTPDALNVLLAKIKEATEHE